MADISIIKKNYIHYVDRIINNNRVSHAYLVEVDNYDDDLSYIYHFIKMILCNLSYSDVEKSNNPIIHQIDHHNYPDITVISSDTNVINKSLLIDLQKEFSNKSLINGKRIYIIKESEKLNGFSANTILKFLEEPEDDIIAFLLTDNRYHVIDTILSRCQVLSLKEENSILNYCDSFLDFFHFIINPNDFFIHYNSSFKDSFVDKSVIKEHLLLTENVLLQYLENNQLISENVRVLISKLNNQEIINIISIVEDELPKLYYNVNVKLWCDSFFSKIIGGCTND